MTTAATVTGITSPSNPAVTINGRRVPYNDLVIARVVHTPDDYRAEVNAPGDFATGYLSWLADKTTAARATP